MRDRAPFLTRVTLFAACPLFGAFTLAIHAWTVATAWLGGGSSHGLSVLVSPFSSWFWLATTITQATGTIANAYAVAILTWAACTLLLAATLVLALRRR